MTLIASFDLCFVFLFSLTLTDALLFPPSSRLVFRSSEDLFDIFWRGKKERAVWIKFKKTKISTKHYLCLYKWKFHTVLFSETLECISNLQIKLSFEQIFQNFTHFHILPRRFT